MEIIREGLASTSFSFHQFHLKNLFMLESNGMLHWRRRVMEMYFIYV